ncbi:DUF3159 domain-containing protein [Nocardia tengchongensis]|uniref:DUF3159 domain-containing protein n=1 Tax=Nocardia tengchongensis TaxID=2055889 RepID=UPI0036245B31
MNNPQPMPGSAGRRHGVADVVSKVRDLGGTRHLIDGAAPILGYLVGYAIAGTLAGISAALLAAVLVAALRLRHGDRLQVVAASTALVVALSGIAAVTGEGRDFFLLPLILYTALAVVFGASLLTGTPLTLPICRRIRFEPAGLPDPAARIRLHRRLTAAWALFCATHVVIMGPVYLTGNVIALGTLALILNKPALVVAIAATWAWVRRNTRT